MARRSEPSFRVSKLDLLISLMASHLGLELVNPVIVSPEDSIERVLFAGLLIMVSLIGLVAWNSRRQT